MLEYDSEGYRLNVTGHRRHKIADDAIISNLRYRWREELSHLSDQELIDFYDDFSSSDWSGNNDARFLEWVG